MLAFDRTGYALPLIFAVVMHEGGHLLVMWILDCPPKRVRLVPAAVEITTAFGCSRKKEIAVALAGPAVNLVLFSRFGLIFSPTKTTLCLCARL